MSFEILRNIKCSSVLWHPSGAMRSIEQENHEAEDTQIMKNHGCKLPIIHFKTHNPQISLSSKQGKDKKDRIDMPGISTMLNTRAREWSVALKSNGTDFSTNWLTLPCTWVQIASGPICCPSDPKTQFLFHWGCRGTLSSKYPNKIFFFSADTERKSHLFPRCDLKKISYSEGKVCLVRAMT